MSKRYTFDNALTKLLSPMKLKIIVIVFISLFPGYIPGFASDTDSIPRKRLKVIPFPNLAYSPETRLFFGGVALFTLHLYDNPATRKTTFKTELNFTQNKQVILGTNYHIFLENNSWYLYGDNSFFKFPENFWGIGSDTENNMEERYDARRLELDNSFLKRFKGGFYAGPRYRLHSMYNIKPFIGGELDEGTVPGAEGGISSGLGYTLNYDTRDNLMNPWKGMFLSFSNVFFDDILGSDFKFTRFEADLRKYIPFKSKKHLLALQAYGVFNAGTPPFRMMGLLGSDSHMRGYYQGRYRDRQYAGLQAEYRRSIYRMFGAAAFAGAGNVAYDLSDFGDSALKPFGGIGLRIRVDKTDNVNLRFDYALGKGSDGFYVVFGEAF